jgi:hypothetical protein
LDRSTAIEIYHASSEGSKCESNLFSSINLVFKYHEF